MVDNQRRKILTLSGTVLATGLAGCQSDSSDEEPAEATTETSVPNQKTRIELLEQNNLEIVPIVNEDTIDNVAGVKLEVEDQDGLRSIRVSYTDDHRDEPFSLYDKTGEEFENGEEVQISEEFPQRILAPQTGEFTVNVTDVNVNTETRNQEIHNLNASYRADRKRKSDNNSEIENIGNYTTERGWDNIVTDIPELRETQQRVLQEQAYSPLVDQVMAGEDLSSRGELFPNWEGEDDGYFDQDAVKNEDDFETLVRWYLPAIMDHDDQNYGNAPSGRNDRFAATLETLINDHHPSAEAVSTSVKSFPAHGIFGVQDTNDEEFYLVDTTSSAQFDEAVGKIGDFITSEGGMRQELWDPFHSFEAGPADYGTYEGKSISAMNALTRFVSKGARFDIKYEERQGNPFITDEWMDDAYQVLRNGGSIQSIVKPIEDLLYERETNGNEHVVGIYGSLDDTRIAVSSKNEMYEQVMRDPEPQRIKDIENMLQAS